MILDFGTKDAFKVFKLDLNRFPSNYCNRSYKLVQDNGYSLPYNYLRVSQSYEKEIGNIVPITMNDGHSEGLTISDSTLDSLELFFNKSTWKKWGLQPTKILLPESINEYIKRSTIDQRR